MFTPTIVYGVQCFMILVGDNIGFAPVLLTTIPDAIYDLKERFYRLYETIRNYEEPRKNDYDDDDDDYDD